MLSVIQSSLSAVEGILSPNLILLVLIALAPAAIAVIIIYNLTLHPLAKVPGPLIARALPFYPLYLFFQCNCAQRLRTLHGKYGEFVRIAPNIIASGAPGSLKVIWTTKGFEKSDFFDAFWPRLSKHRDLFSTRHSAVHSQRKRAQANIWSMTSVLEMEHYVDNLVRLFIDRIGGLADRKQDMDVGVWTWRFSFDTVGELFFGKPYGFLEQQRDVDDLMSTAGKVTPLNGMMGMSPAWLRPILIWTKSMPGIAQAGRNFYKAIVTGQSLIAERMRQIEDHQDEGRNDMLDKFLGIVADRGEKYDFSVADVEQECFVAMVAGNDTVSIVMSATIYNLAAHPESARLLQKELDQAQLSPTIAYKEIVNLPYLNAVIKEGFRINPVFGYPLGRVVPAGGAEVCGTWFPGGTTIGVSCGTPEFNKSLYGEDVDNWRPDRWLVDREREARMWEDVCGFGIGQRACIGQHLARVELMKVIASLFRHFDLEAKTEYTCIEQLFNRPKNVLVKVTRRIGTSS